MKFSLRWLRDHLDLSVTPEVLVEKLTLAGTEVEHWQTLGWESDKVVIAEIRSFQQHPNADRLRICRVFDGKNELQIVCGAKNFGEGDRAPLALPGAKLPGGLTIKEGKLRGEKSEGMMCSSKELNLAAEAEGILILPKDAPLGTPLHQYLKGDTEIEVEITPNRPDLCSYRGLARELSVIECGTLKPTSAVSSPKTENLPAPTWRVELLDAEAAPFYTATVFKNVKVGASPEWLREKITATGHQSINNVVDITNFVLWETGQPLHAFDAAKLSGKTIRIRRAQAGEVFAGLDGKSYTLNPSELVIADEKGAIALAGILGGTSTGMGAETTEMILECAWFQPSVVRSGARRLGVMTDSSYRFERRVDPAGARAARDLAVKLFQEIAGAEVAEARIEAGTAPILLPEITLRLARVSSYLGVSISTDRIRSWLQKLGLELLEENSEVLKWRAPSFRPDLKAEIDLLEEIARLNGMEAVPSRLKFQPQMTGVVDAIYEKTRSLRLALASRGFQECLTDPFLDRARASEGAVEVINPLNEQFTHLRPNLKASMLTIAAKNFSKGNTDLRLFEVGRTFSLQGEETHLAVILTGATGGLHWLEKARETDPFDLLGVRDYLKGLGIQEGDFLESGQLSPSELKKADIKGELFYFEVKLDRWLGVREGLAKYRSLPVYPAVRRDVALVLAKAKSRTEVEGVIRATQIPTLEKIELFDCFEDPKGEKIPVDQKSLAFALTYRAEDRTLTDVEVNRWHDQVRAALQKELGGTLREG